MKIVKNKYLVLRALKEKYNPDEPIAWCSTVRELAKSTGLNDAQCKTVSNALARDSQVRAISTKKTVKSGNRIKNVPVLSYTLTGTGAIALEQMENALAALGIEVK